MNADHAAQLRLLDLQAVDTHLAQLAHRRRTLPELSAIAEAEKQSGALRDEAVDAQIRADDAATEQRRLENEVDTVRARTERDNSRLQGGGLPAKELEGLQHEIATLARRQASLEDDLLELMEQREQADTEVARLAAAQADVEAAMGTQVQARDAAFAEIDAVSAGRNTERAALAAELPADLIALYERAREHGGGVGAAMLKQRRCEGCRIELSGSELAAARAAAPEDVLRCDNCRRILVRTAESGL